MYNSYINSSSSNKKRRGFRNKKAESINWDRNSKDKKYENLEHNFKISTRLSILLDRPSITHEEQIKHSWNAEDCSPNIYLEKDGITAHRRRIPISTDCIRGKVGFTEGLHVWEIIWPSNQRGSNAYIGVATSEANLQSAGYQSLLGIDNQSWGFNINAAAIMHETYLNVYPKKIFGRNLSLFERYRFKLHTIQVVLNMDKGTLGFIANGRYLGEAFEGLKGKKLYPIISAVWGDSRITMKYIGGMDPNPLSLQELCKYIIREKINKIHLEEHIKLLQLPKSIEAYLCNQKRN